MNEYTFFVDFTEFVPLYNGLTSVWIGDGGEIRQISTNVWAGGTAGYLYAKYHDGYTQSLGFVSDYEEAKQYFEDLGITLTYAQWVALLAAMPANAQNAEVSKLESESWAKGTRDGTAVPSADPAYNNNSKYWAEQSKEYTDGKNLNGTSVPARVTDNAEYFKNQAEAWAIGKKNGADVPSTDSTYHNNSKYYSEQAAASAGSAGQSASDASGFASNASGSAGNASQSASSAEESNLQAESWAKGTRNGSADNVRQNASTDNAKAYSDQSKLWANNGTDGDTPSSSNNAKAYSNSANEFERQAESWAKGTRDGSADGIRANAVIDNAKAYSEVSESWAKGTRGGSADTIRSNASTDNSYYYSEESKKWANFATEGETPTSTNNAKYYAGQASGSASSAEESNLEAESWAKGTRDGNTDSVRQDASTDNALYYSSQAKLWANNGTEGNSPSATNNAKYYANQAATAQTNAETAVAHYPRIAVNKNWEIWDVQNSQWTDSGSKAFAEATITYEYLNSQSGSTPPTGTWNSNPNPVRGMYMWIRITYTWTTGVTDTKYIVSYIGEDGTGAVNSVNSNIGSNSGVGDVVLDASNIYVDKTAVTPVTIASAITPITNAQIDTLFV